MATSVSMRRGRSVLVLVEHFPPAFRAGGPTRSVPSIIRRLSHSTRFHVIACDRDAGQDHPLEGITPDVWCDTSLGPCIYLTPGLFFLVRLRRAMTDIDHDVLYANSVFSIRYTLLPLLLRRLRLVPRKPLTIAPRGELALGALGIRRARKRVYLWIFKRLERTAGITWHATGAAEEAEIRRLFGRAAGVVIAPNITVVPAVEPPRDPKAPGRLRMVFISRISPKKNLHHALRTLGRVESRIVFHIYGPIDDPAYWRRCQREISRLPANIDAEYGGVLSPDRVTEALSRYDLFFLPTLGENFGHAIAEALLASCPVLISDRTPWRDLTSRRAGWDLPLVGTDQFRRAIERCAAMSPDEHSRWARAARSVGLEAVTKANEGSGYLRLFGSPVADPFDS